MPPPNANPSHQLANDADEDWSGWSDAQSRRRVQNRLNQRARRERKISEKWQPEYPVRIRQIMPRLDGKEDDAADNNHDQAIIIGRLNQNQPVVRSIDILSETSPALKSSHARKMFHYASTFFWPALYTTSATNDLCQSSIMEPLFLDTVIWAMATIQTGAARDAECIRTICESQLRATSVLRQSLAAGVHSDAVLSCIASLAIRKDQQQQQPPSPPPRGLPPPPGLEPEPPEPEPVLGLFRSMGVEHLGGLHVAGHISYEPGHYNFYRRLLTARGGMETVVLPGIAERLTLADLWNACRDLSRPSFVMCRTFQGILRNEMANDRPPVQEVLAFPVDSSNHALREVLLDLRKLCVLLDQYSDDVQTGKRSRAEPAGDLVNRRDIVQHRVLALPRDHDNDNGAGEICRLATLVFTLGVTYPLPTRRPLRLAATLLEQALRDEQRTGDRDPAFLFWAAMVGGLAAGGSNDALALFYRDRLGALVDELGLRSDWRAAKSVLRRFIWVERACDEGGYALWDRSRRSRDDAENLGVFVTDTLN